MSKQKGKNGVIHLREFRGVWSQFNNVTNLLDYSRFSTCEIRLHTGEPEKGYERVGSIRREAAAVERHRSGRLCTEEEVYKGEASEGVSHTVGAHSLLRVWLRRLEFLVTDRMPARGMRGIYTNCGSG